MSIPLPALPERPSFRTGHILDDDELRARDQEIVRVVLEAAATKAENTICPCCYPDGSDAVAEDIAAAIRALEFHHE